MSAGLFYTCAPPSTLINVFQPLYGVLSCVPRQFFHSFIWGIFLSNLTCDINPVLIPLDLNPSFVFVEDRYDAWDRYTSHGRKVVLEKTMQLYQALLDDKVYERPYIWLSYSGRELCVSYLTNVSQTCVYFRVSFSMPRKLHMLPLTI